MVEGVFERECT